MALAALTPLSRLVLTMENEFEVALIGYGVITPRDIPPSAITPNLDNAEEIILSRKLARYSCRSMGSAIAASERSFDMANLDPFAMTERFGFYTSQIGQQHSDLDDFERAFTEAVGKPSLEESLWHTRMINPFLAIKGLTNNLLGLLSLRWSWQGECAAFARDQEGMAAALDTAVFSIKTGIIDSALVLSSGPSKDIFEAALRNENVDSSPQSGAIALLLQNGEIAEKNRRDIIFTVRDIGISYQPENNFRATQNGGTATKIFEAGIFSGETGQEWGGVLLSIAQMASSVINQGSRGSVIINRQEARGMNVTVTIAAPDSTEETQP